MADEQRDIVIIGSGAGGAPLAQTLVNAGHDVLMLEKGPLLRTRNPGRDPLTLPRDAFADLYDEMAADQVGGWDTGRYGSPRFFLLLLRRHAMTGAFVHPRHGGNSGTAGWADLQSRCPFDWGAAMEAPLGRNTDYRG